MNERDSLNAANLGSALSTYWQRFWFEPSGVTQVARLRGAFCLLAIVYLLSSLTDLTFWYTGDGPLSNRRLASFLELAGIEEGARFIVSPLFLVDTAWVYYLYLAIAIALAIAVMAGRGGSVAAWCLWAMVAGWANRSMFLSGIAEPLLSLGLFASAIAVPGPAWIKAKAEHHEFLSWRNTFAASLMAAQFSVIAICTFAGMLAGEVWSSGLGAYALAAPVSDRWINWTEEGGILVNALVHESITHFLVWGIPVGLLFGWTYPARRWGRGIFWFWSLLVALLGSHFLYAACVATMASSLAPRQRDH